jgi:hypothetical protein
MIVTTVLSGWLSSAGRLPFPGNQVADAIDGMVGDTGKHVAQIDLRVEPAHLGRLCRGTRTAAIHFAQASARKLTSDNLMMQSA